MYKLNILTLNLILIINIYMNHFKNIKVNPIGIYYENPKITKILLKISENKYFKETMKFFNCQLSKCSKERNEYMIVITKIISFKKISLKKRKLEIKKIQETEEYKKSVNCIIKNCFDIYKKAMKLKDKSFKDSVKIYNEIINEYKKTLSTLKKVKFDDKLINKFKKSNKKELNTLNKNEIKNLYQKFIKDINNQIKFMKKQIDYYDKYYKALKKFIPIYEKLLKEDKKEEYIYHHSFEPYLLGIE